MRCVSQPPECLRGLIHEQSKAVHRRQIAKRLNTDLHRIEYLLRTRPIAAAYKVGNAFAYDESAIDAIELELRRVQSRRQEARHA